MIDITKDGLTQATIGALANVGAPKVSRYIGEKDFKPLQTIGKKHIRYPLSITRQIIKHLFANKKPVIKKKHAFYNFKGGTGKTSICFQISSHMALMGYKVLVIDADPQGHLSSSCGFSFNDNYLTLYDIIVKKVPASDVIKTIFEGLDCIPSNLALTRLEPELSNFPKREERMLLDLKELEQKYDFIFIDTNPTISHLNRNVITYCDVINIVCETRPYSLNGLRILMEDLVTFYHSMQIESADLNIIPNKYEDRMTSSGEAMALLRENYGDFLKPDFAIRRSEDINTAAKTGRPLALFVKRTSVIMNDIIELMHYLIEHSTKSHDKK